MEKTMKDEEVFDVALSFDESLTPIEKKTLLVQYGSSEKILRLGKGLLKNILGRRWTGNRFDPEKFISDARNIRTYIERSGIGILRFDHGDFPEGLKQIPDPPYLIYYRGDIEFDYSMSIAAVGTRKPNEAGLERTRGFIEYLTQKGMTIISGLAEGIDSQAHKTCVDNGGKTIAVFGAGIDRIYPVTNRELGKSILDKGGGFVSEYPPGVDSQRWYFPRRNRIIVGLSRGVLITQSPGRSGSLISAMLTADYNRDLFVASCGDSTDEKDNGNRMLVMTGAKEIKSPEEIVNNYHYIDV
jgi:DNA processing protein